MLCPNCGKNSTNLRVCGFCQTPYPTDASGEIASPRSSQATPSRGSARVPRTADQSRARRQVAIGLLAAFTIAVYFFTREPVIPAGVVMPNLIASPMSAGEASETLRMVNATAQLEVRDGELTVRLKASAFPLRRDGQLAFAQQYARADEIVQGRKRAIGFLDPDGNRFAVADPATGVSLTR